MKSREKSVRWWTHLKIYASNNELQRKQLDRLPLRVIRSTKTVGNECRYDKWVVTGRVNKKPN